MFQIQKIVRKLKSIKLKPGAKGQGVMKKNSAPPLEEIGYEASSLQCGENHAGKARNA